MQEISADDISYVAGRQNIARPRPEEVPMIYLDNGATSFPKPRQVTDAVLEAMTQYCANPGRSSHFLAARTAQEIYKTRAALSLLLGLDDPGRILFTKNCTEALNLALRGILRKGDHVVTSSMEHNAVLRPLKALEKEGVEMTIVRCDPAGRLDPQKIRQAIRPETRMIVLTAASNVTGTIMPLEEVGRIALRQGVLFCVDGAQGAGHMILDAKRQHIDLLAVPGHKGLLGPQGTGFLYVRQGISLMPLLYGGTGTRSKELDPAVEFPESFEAGTVNAPGIIGLGAAARLINKIGIEAVVQHERELTEKLQIGLRAIEGVTVYGSPSCLEKTAVVACNLEGRSCEEVALALNDRYGIAVRAGLHCSGMAHETMGTQDVGCVRMCPGFYTSEAEIRQALEAVKEIAASK